MQTSGTTNDLYALSCPGVTTCYATGDHALLATTDGAHSWHSLPNPTGAALFGIACPDMQTCYAAEDIGALYKTANGGQSWTKQSAGSGYDLNALACPSATVCYAVGMEEGAEIVATADGGQTWAVQANPDSAHYNTGLNAISCPDVRTCYAVGGGGTIVATTDGGQTWRVQHSGTTLALHAVSCPTAVQCAAVGDMGTVLHTTTGGSSWVSAKSIPKEVAGQTLYAVDCTDSRFCHVVGGFGTVMLSTDGGQQWYLDKQLTTDDGRAIACPSATTCYVAGGHGMVLSTTTATSAKTVTLPPTCKPFHPKNASAPGQHIYFVRGPYIYVATSSGDVRQLTHTGTAKIPDRDPAISPDGRALAYTHQYRGGGIWVMSSSGGTARSLSGADFLADLPAWAPDGHAVAYNMEFPCVTCGGGYSLALMVRSYPAGKALSARYGLDVAPSWSGDGCSLVTSEYQVLARPATYWNTLASVNILSQQAAALSHDPVHNYLFPSVSPDGRSIAYVRTSPHSRAHPDSSATGSLWVMNANGTGARELAAAVDTARPAWSPDGSALAFGDAGSIYVIPAKGGTARLVIKDGSTPAWGR